MLVPFFTAPITVDPKSPTPYSFYTILLIFILMFLIASGPFIIILQIHTTQTIISIPITKFELNMKVSFLIVKR